MGVFVGFFYEVEGFWPHFGEFLLFGRGEGEQVGFEQGRYLYYFRLGLVKYLRWDCLIVLVGFHVVLLWLNESEILLWVSPLCNGQITSFP